MSPLWVPQSRILAPFFVPSGMSYETYPHNSQGTAASGYVSGSIGMVGIALPAGTVVGHIAFEGVAAAVTPTHWWFGLYNSARVQLATTADQTTTAWGGNTEKNLAIATTAAGAASSFTTTYTGIHYLGICMSAGTTVTLNCLQLGFTASSKAPIITGVSTAAQTTPPAFAFTGAALASSTNYAYATVGP